MIKLMVIALIVSMNATAQNGLQYTDYTVIRFYDMENVMKIYRKPGTDSIFTIKVFSGDTTWYHRFVLNPVAGFPAWADITDKPTTTAWLSNSTNKNFVTDEQSTVIGNTSGTNSGNDAANSTYANDYRAANFIAGTNYQAPIPAGTTSQYYRGDKTWQTYQGYTINVQALTSSPADGATVYFGTMPKAPVSAAATSKIYIRKAGTLKIAEIYCYSGTAGTNESWSVNIRVNNITDHLIATVSVSTSERIFSKTDLSITLNVGDYIEIKVVNPTWATNPLTTIWGGYFYIE